MRNIALALGTTLLSLSLAAQTAPTPVARGSASPDMVSVTGVGKVMTPPDRVSFTVGVETTAPTVEDAVAQNNNRTSNVIAALKKAGARAEEIRTSNFSIFPQWDYQSGQRPRLIGYQVTNSVSVTRNNITDAGKLLQAAVTAGVNQASGLNFSVSDPSRGREEGLRRAFEDARAKAAVLAQAAGRALGPAISITEAGAVQPPPRPMAMKGMVAAEARVAEVPVEQGTEELSFGVAVVFELR